MKKFSINCDFGGQMSPFTFFIGKPEHGHHPLHFQADWLSKQRGGVVPSDVMEAISQLQELAEKNGVSLEELCVYALGTKEDQAALEKESMEEDYSKSEDEDESLEEESKSEDESLEEESESEDEDESLEEESESEDEHESPEDEPESEDEHESPEDEPESKEKH